jgi:hypothetical protein
MPTTGRAKRLKNENFRIINNLLLVETVIKNTLNWKYLEA